MDALVNLIDDIIEAQSAEATDEQLELARQMQRRASFYVDYVEAENSSGFHAGQEAMRILADSINFSRMGQNSLKPFWKTDVPPKNP